eukprot:790821-Prymnesium_polylepis.1
MSIEVGEHIPRKCIPNFVRVLTKLSRLGIVLSWAHHGQPGRGHVSPKSKAEVIDLRARPADLISLARCPQCIFSSCVCVCVISVRSQSHHMALRSTTMPQRKCTAAVPFTMWE